jgi:hypothetical protein
VKVSEEVDGKGKSDVEKSEKEIERNSTGIPSRRIISNERTLQGRQDLEKRP